MSIWQTRLDGNVAERETIRNKWFRVTGAVSKTARAGGVAGVVACNLPTHVPIAVQRSTSVPVPAAAAVCRLTGNISRRRQI